MRQLAEQGRSGPILGGGFLAGAGVVFGAACFVQWAMMARGVTSLSSILALWGGAMVLFVLVWLLLFFQLRARAPIASFSNSTFSASWLGSGIGITVGCIAVAIVAEVMHAPAVMMSYPSMVFAFYGTAWLISAILVHRRWMFVVAGGAYAIALIMALLIGHNLMLPAMGTALLLTLTVPGVLLMREKTL
jgi:hypothetical protein